MGSSDLTEYGLRSPKRETDRQGGREEWGCRCEIEGGAATAAARGEEHKTRSEDTDNSQEKGAWSNDGGSKQENLRPSTSWLRLRNLPHLVHAEEPNSYPTPPTPSLPTMALTTPQTACPTLCYSWKRAAATRRQKTIVFICCPSAPLRDAGGQGGTGRRAWKKIGHGRREKASCMIRDKRL
eukprot:753965-Hanusia_phi.AAC.7